LLWSAREYGSDHRNRRSDYDEGIFDTVACYFPAEEMRARESVEICAVKEGILNPGEEGNSIDCKSVRNIGQGNLGREVSHKCNLIARREI
jgi:hypothetical protein